MKNRQITVVDVAKYAGVSTATVSRVLHNNPKVDPELKKKVIHAAETLKYEPNANAQSLKTRHTYEIGFLVSDISNPYYGTIARIVENIISPQNYNLIICSHAESPARERAYLTMMQRRHVEALIINPTCENNDLVARFSHNIPTIAMNRKILHEDFQGDYIDTNGYAGCRILTRRLLEAGHRDIYCVHAPAKYPNAMERLQGFKDAMAEYGISVDENYPYLFDGQFTYQGGIEAVRHMASFDPMPTAVLSVGNLSTLAILREFQRLHISVPEDISIATHDHIENCELMRWQPETASYDLNAIAETVGNLILFRVHNPDGSQIERVFEPIIHSGNTIARPSISLAAKLSEANQLMG